MRDQEAAQHEEKIDAHPAAQDRPRELPDAERQEGRARAHEGIRDVVKDHEEDGDPPEAVERGQLAPLIEQTEVGPDAHAPFRVASDTSESPNG